MNTVCTHFGRFSGLVLFLVGGATVFLLSCSEDAVEPLVQEQTGALTFYTNGEEFIRDGFTSKDGWEISFDHFFVNIYGPTAVQVDVEEEADERSSSSDVPWVPLHAGHPHTGVTAGGAHVALVGDFLVDLARSPLSPEEERTPIGTVEDRDGLDNLVSTGNYNMVNFNVQPVLRNGDMPTLVDPVVAEDAESMDGYSVRMVGRAEKRDPKSGRGEILGFDITLLPVLDPADPDDSGIAFSSCLWESEEGSQPGIVNAGGSGSVELTLHADHIFGDWADGEPAPDLNDFAPGFDPFAKIAEESPPCDELGFDRCLWVGQDELRVLWAEESEDHPELRYAYAMLIYALGTVGHSGEGHCLH